VPNNSQSDIRAACDFRNYLMTNSISSGHAKPIFGGCRSSASPNGSNLPIRVSARQFGLRPLPDLSRQARHPDAKCHHSHILAFPNPADTGPLVVEVIADRSSRMDLIKNADGGPLRPLLKLNLSFSAYLYNEFAGCFPRFQIPLRLRDFFERVDFSDPQFQ
jgi:hypothetical protein